VVEGVHFLARLGVFAFFCKYRDKKCTPGANRQWMCGGWLGFTCNRVLAGRKQVGYKTGSAIELKFNK